MSEVNTIGLCVNEKVIQVPVTSQSYPDHIRADGTHYFIDDDGNEREPPKETPQLIP